MRVRACVQCAVALTMVVACGPPVAEVCGFEADCWLKSCEWSADACEALADGRNQSCVADQQAELDALATGDVEQCRACERAIDEWLNCVANLDSCAALDRAGDQDGDCAAEHDSRETLCRDIDHLCYQ